MPHPRTGEKRRIRQPLNIDRLPVSVQEAILTLRNQPPYKTWEQIEALSAEPYGRGSLGFVDWDSLDPAVLGLFPRRSIPHTNLHRWYDLRFDQVQRETMQSAEQAARITKYFAAAAEKGADQAVINAARSQIMSLISDGSTSKDKLKIAQALTDLGQLLQTSRGNDIKERKVTADERKIAMLERREAALMRKLEAETEKLARKATTGQITQEDINRLRERSFGLPPIQQVSRAA